MKKFCFALATVLAICTISVAAQALPSDILENAQGQFIVHSDKFSLVNYQLEDGTALKQKDLSALLTTVPGNDVFLEKSKAWKITGFTFLGLAIASVGTNLVYTLADDLPGKNEVVPTTAYVAIGSSIFSLLALELGAWNQMKAIDNYNIKVRVQGVPVN